MKEIALTKGLVALVDNEDYDFLNQWKWHAHKNGNAFYAQLKLWDRAGKKYKHYLMHRMIMGQVEGMSIDHINHNGIDNRKENLRIVTHRQNHCNRIKQNKFIGVSFEDGRYRARININGKLRHLGMFATPEEAHNAYVIALPKPEPYKPE